MLREHQIDLRAYFWIVFVSLTALSVSALTYAGASSAPSTTAQSTTSPSTQTAPEAAPQAPFSLAEAATQAEYASIRLRSIETLLRTDRGLSDIERDEPVLASEIESRLAETAALLGASPSLQLLGSQEQDWTAIEQELAEWKQSLQHRQDRLQEAYDEIKQMRATWDQENFVVEYWLKHVPSPELLQPAQGSIESTRILISRTSDDLHQARKRLFAIEQAVDVQEARVLDVLDSVRQAKDDAFSRLLTRDSPPLWEVLRTSTGSGSQTAAGQESFGRQVDAVWAYVSRRSLNVAVQVGVMIALALGLRWVYVQTQKWAEKKPELSEPTRVFASPIATAMVLALLLSGWLYPRAPRLLWAIIEAAALIPTVVILRRLTDPRWLSALNALVVFYFLDQIRSVAAVWPGVERVLLLIEMLGGAILLIAVLRPSWRSAASSKRSKLVRFACGLWAAIFLLASIGDVLGYVGLANLLGEAALGSAYMAVIIYAFTRIVSGFLVIAMHSRPLAQLKMVRQHEQLILLRMNRILIWVASAAWAWGVLNYLAVASATWALLQRILTAELSYGQIHLSLGHVVVFAFTIWLSVQISRFLRFVLEEDVYDRFALPGGIPYAISKIINYCILLLGFFVAVSALGYDLTKFTILAGAFGVGLGFGLQNIVNNWVSGLILLFERPVKVGDVIQMDDTTGVVAHIGIRASIIRTLNSAEIIVPNGNLISNKVTNWTLSNRQRGIEIKLAAGPSVKPAEVIELLTSIARENKQITNRPAPEAILTGFSADAFNYELHAWTNNADEWMQIRSDLSVAIHDALVARNIPIK
jgi:potassium-dependent mechanosensitive channel